MGSVMSTHLRNFGDYNWALLSISNFLLYCKSTFNIHPIKLLIFREQGVGVCLAISAVVVVFLEPINLRQFMHSS